MEPVVVLDARVPGRHARPAVEALADDEWVVVVRRGLDVSYEVQRAGAVRGVGDDDAVGDVLGTGVPVAAWRLDGDEPEPPGPSVVVDPSGVLGSVGFDALDVAKNVPGPTSPVAPSPDGDASPGDRPSASFPFPTTRPGDDGSDTTRSWDPPETAARPLPPPPATATPAPPPETAAPPPPTAPPSPPDDDTNGAGHGADPDDGDRAELQAHPRVQAPEQVTGEATFDLTIGLGDEPMGPGVAARAMRILDVAPTFDLEVQVVAPDFGMPEGGRRFLHVRRDTPTAAATSVSLVAPAVDEPRRLTVRVEYVHAGMPIGQAWRDVVVTPTDDRVDATVDSGAAAIVVSDPSTWADLTVIVSEGERPDLLTWSFFTRHDVTVAEQASRSLDAADARAFAHQQVVRLGASAGSELEVTELTGVARIVADVMPPEFWHALAAVAEVTDGPASVFLVTADPWVPWELASTEPTYLPPELVDPDLPAFLGAQFRVARWLEQRAYGRFMRPDHPPARHHAIERICLVIGDYLAERGQRPLPAAIEEGKVLAERYPSVWRAATAVDLGEVLGDRIRERGEAVEVDALHLACHGRVTDDLRASGIVLSDDERTLSPTTIRGSKLSQTQHPFVFLNACQVGQATTNPGGYGGMAGAFVREGATGFVAPLWEVGDTLAQQAALDFYADTLDEGIEVAEAMRRFRAGFTKGESTRLAYVYYGHPALTLSTAADRDPAPATVPTVPAVPAVPTAPTVSTVPAGEPTGPTPTDDPGT